ncbi:hypothetical protein D3C81_1859200 [compost metagenome]
MVLHILVLGLAQPVADDFDVTQLHGFGGDAGVRGDAQRYTQRQTRKLDDRLHDLPPGMAEAGQKGAELYVKTCQAHIRIIYK